MKRDDWKLGNGIVAGDTAMLDGDTHCSVLKVSGGTIKGYESGNVLIEVDGEKMTVLGSRLYPE